MNHYHASGR